MAIQDIGRLTAYNDTQANVEADTAAATEIRFARRTTDNALGFCIGGTWYWITAGGGGDVLGPASSADNTIARFNGADNKTIQGSLATVDDSGGINIPSGQTYNINGSAHTHAGGGGDVIAPGSATPGNLAVFGADPQHIIDGGAVPAGSSPDGWTAAGQTWTYEAADDPTYTFSEPIDATGKYSIGMKIKCTQGGSVKYGIITGVGSYTGGKTIITAYWGTDYNLGATITNPYYSVVKAPFGFPMDPTKWTVEVTDAGASLATPTQNVWYNINNVAISIPIGAWDVEYYSSIGVDKAAAGTLYSFITLSTANNSESDAQFTARALGFDIKFLQTDAVRRKTLVLSSKTSYYLNSRTTVASVANLWQDYSRIVAVCAYL